ncbi:MAG: hypothetical protein ABJ205_13975 [Erythrobacter sp.]|uniref:hypothetical protein n=1 Tax=Erythrobacter sp. TaxID=1042 RepID=UPI003264A45E
MRKSQYQMSGVAAAALGFLAASPSLATAPQEEGAKDAGPSQLSDPALSAKQQAEVDSWPVEQQTAYMGWPAETKGYYWSLTSSKQMLFWRLTDEQKIALTAMTGPEREAAWQRIEGSASSPR